MSKATYWKTVEYLGGGFVLQRMQHDGDDFVEYYDINKERWTTSNWSGDFDGTRCQERVIHINDAAHIDTSTIDVGRVEQLSNRND